MPAEYAPKPYLIQNSSFNPKPGSRGVLVFTGYSGYSGFAGFTSSRQ